MIGRTISQYVIEEKLGAGGMGVVYKARDRKLDRAVALKFLPHSLSADQEMRRRFVREAKAASSLDHPNICTIYDVEETEDGELFMAMACYTGETLKSTIAHEPMSLARAIDITMQVAKGLAAAHEALIIHRDVKPGNIIVTERGTVKILDFGLAKLAGRTDISAPDAAIGTPAYMSPEQLRSQSVDHRTDIWSLAVVFFEMLTGRLPFRGDRAETIIHSILTDTPETASKYRSDLEADVDRLFVRALQRSPRDRYARIEDFMADLQELYTHYDSRALPIMRVTPRAETSIAVLPFVDLSPARDQEYFCDGMAEEILRALSGIKGVYVASRTSSFQFRGTQIDIREIGEKLNVSSVVEGSVRKFEDRVRVTVQLIKVADGYRLWSERYDREMKDIFAIQDDISARIAEALEVTLCDSDQPTVQLSTRNITAYDIDLQGRHFFHLHRRKGYEVARQMFLRSIEIEPNNARAWAGIANCCSFLHRFFGHGPSAISEADSASRRALELDSTLAETHAARGMALSLQKRFDEAEQELQRAIELNSSHFDAYYFHGGICLEQGRLEDAARHFARACAITPEEYFTWLLLGPVYKGLGEEVKANAATREGLEQARKRLTMFPDDTRALTMAAGAFAELGETDRALSWLERALAIDPEEPIILYNAACAYVALGRHAEALDCLERAVGPAGCLSLDWIEHDPDLQPLRGEARYLELIDRLAGRRSATTMIH